MVFRACLLGVLLSALLAGCGTVPASWRRAMARPYKPENVYVAEPAFPLTVRRVALLPLSQNSADASQAAGADLLAPVLLAELSKRHLFEIMPVSQEQLSRWTGRMVVTAEEQLSPDFFDRLQRATGCEAVLFATLTVFQAYPPLQTGWKARLVECHQGQTLWAVDEVFDAGCVSVAAAATAYAHAELELPNPLLEETGILHSPRRFGQYTAYAIANTLPSR